VSLLVITGTPSILHISPYSLAVRRVLVEQLMVHHGHFPPITEGSTALASKDQQKTWEFIFYGGPIRVTLQLPESFYFLT